jgi:hypothetical protein
MYAGHQNLKSDWSRVCNAAARGWAPLRVLDVGLCAALVLSLPALQRHERSIVPRLGIHFVNLGGESQPTLRKVEMCELAFRVGHGVGCPEAFVGAHAESVARYHGIRFSKNEANRGHHMHRSTDITLGEKIDQLGRWAPLNLVDEPALQTLNPTRPRQAADSEALKSETVGSRVGVTGEQPYRAGQGRAALHAAVGDIFKIVRLGTVIQMRRCDGRDRHPVSAMWAGEKEARQARCRNTQVSHGTPPIRTYPTTCAYFPPLS